MPTIKPTYERIDDNAVRLTYAEMANGDDGEPFQLPDFPDRSVQVTGTLGAGGTLTVEGANDDTPTYHALTDPQGNSLAINALKVEKIQELTRLTRPRVTAGDGTTSLNVSVYCRRPKPVNK